MPAAITIEALPARHGDCLLVECSGEGRPWRALIDGGPADTWPRLRDRLLRLPPGDRRLDLVVVTHIDADHIGGALRFFEEEEQAIPGLTIGDVWFNALPQLPDPDGFADARSVQQGEDLVALLGGDRPGKVLPWNRAFAGHAVVTPDHGAFTTHSFHHGPTLTLLSPTPKRLAILRRKWLDALNDLRRGVNAEDETQARPPVSLDDLPALAAKQTPKDGSAPNGSSIAFLLEHRGASCLLTGDAFGNVVAAALAGLAEARGTEAIHVGAFKLPHHGSRGNVTTTLIDLAPAEHYLVSSNGDTFGHPDPEAIARVVTGPSDSPRILFNYETPETTRWRDPALQAKHSFTTTFPERGTAGIRLVLPAVGRT